MPEFMTHEECRDHKKDIMEGFIQINKKLDTLVGLVNSHEIRSQINENKLNHIEERVVKHKAELISMIDQNKTFIMQHRKDLYGNGMETARASITKKLNEIETIVINSRSFGKQITNEILRVAATVTGAFIISYFLKA